MGIDIYGWIERKFEFNNQIQWFGVVKIDFGLGMGRNKPMFDHFFYDKDAIVGCRGLPEVLSREVKAELANIQEGNFCQAWFTWNEMLMIDWKIMSSDWQLIYDMMELLCKKHGEENVRIVIWFG